MCDILAYFKKKKIKRDYLQKNIEDKKGKKIKIPNILQKWTMELKRVNFKQEKKKDIFKSQVIRYI